MRGVMKVLAVSAALLLPGLPAWGVTAQLDNDNCTGGCLVGTDTSVGTVTALQNGSDVDFTVQLNSGYVFQKSTGLTAFVFGFTGVPSPTITNLTAGFSVDPTSPVHQDGFGDFLTGILKAATGGDLLEFTVQGVTLAMLAFSSGSGGEHVNFAVDVFGNGNTGAVGGNVGTPGPSPVPVPPAALLFGSGLLSLTFLRRRKKAA